jgi:hypothetical protein
MRPIEYNLKYEIRSLAISDDDDDDDDNNNNNNNNNTNNANGSGKEIKIQEFRCALQPIWNLKCTIIPVIIGATGIVTRNFTKNLEAISGKY